MEVRRKRLDSEVTFEASTDILPNVATSPAILHGGGKDDSWGDEEDMLSVAEESCSQGSSTAGAAQDGAAVPPDGGWGWFVVFGSFMIHIVGEFYFFQKLSLVVVRGMISCYKYLTLKSPMSTHI